MNRKYLAIAAVAVSAVLAPAAHAEHGVGGDSRACSDGAVPGTGVETGSIGSIGPLGIGGQAGSQPAVDHQAYADVCARVDGPSVNLPLIGNVGARYGSYSSVRVHSNPANCSTLAQMIFNVDNDSTLQPPEYNTCRNGE